MLTLARETVSTPSPAALIHAGSRAEARENTGREPAKPRCGPQRGPAINQSINKSNFVFLQIRLVKFASEYSTVPSSSYLFEVGADVDSSNDVPLLMSVRRFVYRCADDYACVTLRARHTVVMVRTKKYRPTFACEFCLKRRGDVGRLVMQCRLGVG